MNSAAMAYAANRHLYGSGFGVCASSTQSIHCVLYSIHACAIYAHDCEVSNTPVIYLIVHIKTIYKLHVVDIVIAIIECFMSSMISSIHIPRMVASITISTSVRIFTR